MGVNSLPKTVTRQCRDCDLNPGSSVPESGTLATRLPSHRTEVIIYDSTQSTVCYRLSTDIDSKLSLCAISNEFLVPFSFSQFSVHFASSIQTCLFMSLCTYNFNRYELSQSLLTWLQRIKLNRIESNFWH